MTRDLVVTGLPDYVLKKLQKWKQEDGFGEQGWATWFRYHVQSIHLADSISELIQKSTRDGLLGTWVTNLAGNLQSIKEGKTIRDLVPKEAQELEAQGKSPDVPIGKTSIVIGRGPSLRKNGHLKMLAESDYIGTLVVSDGALVEVLEAGIQPPKYELFCVLTVDGNREKIWKLYDHELVDKYGPSMKAVMCTSASPNVAERCRKAGVEVYWFHPMFDDQRSIESYTRIEQILTKSERNPDGAPALQCGGNSGACCWVLSWVLLRRSPVALIGLDLGYLPEDDITKTYYYDHIAEATGGNVQLIQSQYATIYNPDTRTNAIVDPVFAHYRESFRIMAANTFPWVTTYNCTGGGSLFGPGITTMDFSEFLRSYKT